MAPCQVLRNFEPCIILHLFLYFNGFEPHDALIVDSVKVNQTRCIKEDAKCFLRGAYIIIIIRVIFIQGNCVNAISIVINKGPV